MTKRGAESILPSDIPPKRGFLSLSEKDNPFGGGEYVAQAAAPSSHADGKRCRKRAKYLDDQDATETDNRAKKIPVNRVNSPTGGDNKRKSPTIGSSTLVHETNKIQVIGNKPDAGVKVIPTDDDLSAFNSFQFWRVPLPKLDLSLLEPESSAGSTTARTSEHEAMET